MVWDKGAFRQMKKMKAHASWDKQKKAALIIFWAVWITFALLIIFHKNVLADPDAEFKKKICGCVLLAFTGLIFSFNIDRLRTLPVELYQNRQLIWKLAKNDFKKRYAGSYLGSLSGQWLSLSSPYLCTGLYLTGSLGCRTSSRLAVSTSRTSCI
jgi:uncharacterized membrane protein (DUF485 family)